VRTTKVDQGKPEPDRQTPNFGISDDFFRRPPEFPNGARSYTMCVLSHAVTYMQAVAAAWLFDEIPNSFAIRGHEVRTPGAYPSSSEKSMPGTNCA
jgi:hypothetical protein